jgi:hypothetical protein
VDGPNSDTRVAKIICTMDNEEQIYGKHSKYFYLIRKRVQTSSYMPLFGFILSILAFQKQQQEYKKNDVFENWLLVSQFVKHPRSPSPIISECEVILYSKTVNEFHTRCSIKGS